MAKFLILFNSTTNSKDLMASSTPEQMKASMDEWMKWRDEAIKTVKFDWGLPLQAVSHLTSTQVSESSNTATGYATMEGNSKEEIVALLGSHPHLKRPDASIDVMEMIPMPGM